MSPPLPPDWHVCEKADPLDEEINVKVSVTEVEHGIHNPVEECHHAMLINFLQKVTKEQWMMLEDGVFDQLGPELTQVCSKIVQLVSDSVTKSVLPGLYQILDIKKEVETPTLPWKPRASSVSSLDMSRVVTVSQAEMASGSGQSSPRNHVQTSSPSSSHVDKKDQGLQHTTQLKHRRKDLTGKSRKNGSGEAHVSTPSLRSPAPQSEEQSSDSNSSDALKILLGVPEDSLFKSLKGNLQQSMKEIADKLYIRSHTSGFQKPSPAMMEEAAKKVISSVSLVFQSASPSQTPIQRSGRRGESLSSLTKNRKKKKIPTTNKQSFSAVHFESGNKAGRESSCLTRDVMTTISDVIVASGDKRDVILLDSLSTKLKILASNYDKAKALVSQNVDSLNRRRTNSQSSISETGSIYRSQPKPMMKLSSREFELSAKKAVSEILMKKASAVLLSSQSAESVAKSAHRVEAAASAVVETFVASMEHLKEFARHEKPPTCEHAVWSTVFQVFKRTEHKLKAFFCTRPPTCQSTCNAAADDQSTPLESRETSPLPPQAKMGIRSKSNSVLQQSSEKVAIPGGLSDPSRPLWTQKNPLEQKLLLTTCTKEVIAELLLLCDTDGSNEDHSSAEEGKAWNKSCERQGFVWEVLSQLEKISLGKHSSIHDDLSVPDCDAQFPPHATLSSHSVQSLFREDFQTAATQAVSELLVKFNNVTSTLAAFNSDANQIDHSTLTKDRHVLSTQNADAVASDIVEIFVEDLQRMAQPTEGLQRQSSVLESIQKLQSRIRSATALLYHGVQEKIKDFSLPQQSQGVRTVSEREPNLPCYTGTVPLLIENSERGFGSTTAKERARRFATKTREVISTILTSFKDKPATDACSSSLRKSQSDESLEVTLFVSGVLTQLEDMSHSPKTSSPFEDFLPEDSLETAFASREQGDTIPIEDIACFLCLSSGGLQRLQSPEFHTQALEDVSGLLNASTWTARDGWTGSENDTLSPGGGNKDLDYSTVHPIGLDVDCPTSSLPVDTASEIIKSVVNDFEELTQPIESSYSHGPTTAQVSERRIWDVAFNMYHHVQSKVKEFLIVQRSNQCITVEPRSSQQEETAHGSIRLNDSIASSQAARLCELEHKRIRRRSTAKGASTKSRPEQERVLVIPGTAMPTGLVPVGRPIIRSTIIEESFGTEDTLPGNLLIQVRQAASAIADEMVESVKPTNKEDGRGIPHPRCLRYAIRKLQKMMSAEVLHDFTHKFLEIVDDLVRDGKGSSHIFKLGKRTLDSTLLWLQWRDRTCTASSTLCARLLPIFAEESLKMILRHFCRQLSQRRSHRLNKKPYASDLEGQSTSACRVIPIRIDPSTSLDYDNTLNQLSNVMKREMMDAISIGSTDIVSNSKAFNRTSVSRTSMATRKIVQGVLTLVQLSSSADNLINHRGQTGDSLTSVSTSSEVLNREDYQSLVLTMSLKLLVEICPHASEREEMSRDVTMLVLSDFYAASGLSGTHTYPPDLKIHRIFRNVYKELLLTFGTNEVLKVAVNIQDPYFISIMAKSLTNELLNTCGTTQSRNVTQVSSPGDPKSGEVKNETHSTATAKKTRKRRYYSILKKWFNQKLKSREEVKMNDPQQIMESQHQPASSTATERDGVPFTSVKEKTRKSTFFPRMVGAITKAFRLSRKNNS
ncbi:uncharacterized protein LOC134039323 [Osmerus eperlanus]|uniref:uncharacterized protein LOC134039323 n=1 Tax=Osmerus eperlanus TaxID=29151 RepID=UPI002E0FDB50